MAYFWALLLLLVSFDKSFADFSTNLDLNSLPPQQYIGSHLFLYEDKSGSMDIEAISRLAESEFTRSNKNAPTFGFNSSPIWVKLVIENRSRIRGHYALQHAYPSTDYVDFYKRSRDGSWEILKSGDKVPAFLRSFPYRYPILKFEAQDEPLVFYIRTQTQGTAQIPIRIIPWDEFQQERASESFFIGGLYFILIAMAVYNFCLYFITRKNYVLPYLLMIIFGTIFNASQQGIFSQVFTSLNLTYLNNQLGLSLGGVWCLCGLWFTFQFLELKKSDRLELYFLAVPALLGFLQATTSLYSYVIAARVGALAMLMYGLCVSVAAVKACLKRQFFIYYFMFAWSLVLVGFVSYSLMTAGVFSVNMYTLFSVLSGITFEVLFLSLAINDKMRTELKNVIKLNKKISEHNLLLADEKAKVESALRLELESKFSLASQIAHRLNNPLNYVQSGKDLLSSTLIEVRSMILALFDGVDADSSVKSLVQKFDNLFKASDEALVQVQFGLEKSTESIKEMRGISGVDGYAIEPIELGKVLRGMQQKIRENLGNSYHERYSLDVQIPDKFEVSSNKYLLSNAIEMLVSQFLKASEEGLVLRIVQNPVSGFTVVGDGIFDLGKFDYEILESKLNALMRAANMGMRFEKVEAKLLLVVFIENQSAESMLDDFGSSDAYRNQSLRNELMQSA